MPTKDSNLIGSTERHVKEKAFKRVKLASLWPRPTPVKAASSHLRHCTKSSALTATAAKRKLEPMQRKFELICQTSYVKLKICHAESPMSIAGLYTFPKR